MSSSCLLLTGCPGAATLPMGIHCAVLDSTVIRYNHILADYIPPTNTAYSTSDSDFDINFPSPRLCGHALSRVSTVGQLGDSLLTAG